MKKKLAIVTITIGEKFWELAKYTHPLFQDYAKKCYSDFVIIDKPTLTAKLGLATYERFQLYDLFSDYERIAFIDSDILVSLDSPNIFELVPTDMLGASSEEEYSMSCRDKALTQEIMGRVEWSNPYFNAGMMVLSRCHKEIFDTNNKDLLKWATGEFRKLHLNLLNDQPFINHRVNKLNIPVMDLGYRFNHTRVITPTNKRFRSYFIHYAGPSGHRYGTRLNQIRKDAEIIASPALLSLSRKFPIYRLIADRFDIGFFQYLLREKFRAK